MTTLTPATTAAHVTARMTDAVWAWLEANLDRMAGEILDEDACMIDAECLSDWCEDAIREDADELVGMVLLSACHLCDWADLGGRAEEALGL